ncbi:S-methyl-5-thioribose-1-phosphate isomerase [soil metagenome]
MIPHPSPLSGASYSTAELALEDDRVIVLDQRLLPEREEYLELRDLEAVCEAIRTLTVRGAPAIGIAAAYGMGIAEVTGVGADEAATRLLATRPTAVNLRHGVETMLAAMRACTKMGRERVEALARHARDYHRADVASCRAIGRFGAALLPSEGIVLTHCNAGALATGGYGTALGVIRAAREAGKNIHVLADETRPLLQGARLTAWELHADGIPVRVLTDSMAAVMMARGGIVACVVGADRIAQNGDAANKIGTYGLACLANAHGIPFYVAAPWSTVDLACPDGASIPIEERRADEVTHLGSRRIVPESVPVENPSFDVTPARLITRIITERGATTPAALANDAAR